MGAMIRENLIVSFHARAIRKSTSRRHLRSESPVALHAAWHKNGLCLASADRGVTHFACLPARSQRLILCPQAVDRPLVRADDHAPASDRRGADDGPVEGDVLDLLAVQV